MTMPAVMPGGLPPSPIGYAPLPSFIGAAVAEGATGSFVLLFADTPAGRTVLWIPPDDIDGLCDALKDAARQATSGLVIAPAGSIRSDGSAPPFQGQQPRAVRRHPAPGT